MFILVKSSRILKLESKAISLAQFIPNDIIACKTKKELQRGSGAMSLPAERPESKTNVVKDMNF